MLIYSNKLCQKDYKLSHSKPCRSSVQNSLSLESRTSCDVLVHWLFSFNQAYKNEWMGLIKIYGFPLRHPQQVMAFMNPHEYLKLATKRNNPRLTHYYKPHMSHTIWSQYEPQFFLATKAGLFGLSPGLQTSACPSQSCIGYETVNQKTCIIHNAWYFGCSDNDFNCFDWKIFYTKDSHLQI